MMYITFNDWAAQGQYGVGKKILGQMRVFADAFGRTYVTVRKAGKISLYSGERLLEQQDISAFADYVDAVLGWLKKYHIGKTYIRYPLATGDFIRLLAEQKSMGIRSVLEVPLYPYDKLLAPASAALQTDKMYRREIARYIERIARVGGEGDIWGIQSIYVFNGIDPQESFPLKHSRGKSEEVVFLVVSSMEPIHGYERLIKGLKRYYGEHPGTSRVRLLFAGTGTEEVRYKRLVQRYALGGCIEFHGFQSGEELAALYDRADIAVGALGGYKYRLDVWDTMKNAEYCRQGLPLVYSHVDLRFPEGTAFVFRVPDDDTPINIGNILEGYDHLRQKEDFSERIQAYARKKLSWSSSLKPVLQYLNTC